MIHEIGRKALHFNIIDQLIDESSIPYRRRVSDQLQRDVDVDLLFRVDRDEVDMLEISSDRVILHLMYEDILILSKERELYDVRLTGNAVDFEEFGIVEAEGDRLKIVSIDDRRYLLRCTQILQPDIRSSGLRA